MEDYCLGCCKTAVVRTCLLIVIVCSVLGFVKYVFFCINWCDATTYSARCVAPEVNTSATNDAAVDTWKNETCSTTNSEARKDGKEMKANISQPYKRLGSCVDNFNYGYMVQYC